jgi:hypothetical protein
VEEQWKCQVVVRREMAPRRPALLPRAAARIWALPEGNQECWFTWDWRKGMMRSALFRTPPPKITTSGSKA